MQIRSFVFFLVFFISNDICSQCTGCTYIAPAGGTNYNLNGNQVLCISGNAANLNINFNGSDNTICVNSGSTYNMTNGGVLSGVDIEVYGTLIMDGNFNFNSPVSINIHPGGIMDFEGNGLNSNNLTINNDGCLNFNSTGQVALTTIKIVNGLDGKVNAISTSRILFVGGAICNSGTMEFTEFENNEMEEFHNKTTGKITFTDEFYNHGAFHNEGFVTVENGLRVGNKGPGKEFLNDGCFCITGDVLFEGTVFNNLTLRIESGDLDINSMVTGVNGSIILEDGVSTIGAAGSYTGTNFTICDQNTLGNDFDVISANSMSLNMYTVDCTGATTACGCGSGVCVVPPAPVLDVTDNMCNPNVDGIFFVVTDCAAGSTIEFSTDGGLMFMPTIPAYDPNVPVTVEARCVDDNNFTCYSGLSSPVTSTPMFCCPIPNCFDITVMRN